MNINDNKELLGILSKFTYYDVDNFRLNEATVKFDYLSIVKNIICKCLYSKYFISIKIDSQEWKRYVLNNEIIIELNDLDRVRNYINSLRVNGFGIKIDNDDIIIDCTYTCININKLNEVVAFVDKLLLNMFMLLDNRDLVDLEDKDYEICIYPKLSVGCSTLYNVHIMSEKYVSYMSYYYSDIISNTMYKFGIELNKNTIIISMGSDDPIGCITRIGWIDYELDYRLEYVGYILNKNFITVIKLLGFLKIDKDIEIRLDNNGDLIINASNKKYYFNSSKEICQDKYVIGRIFGDKILLNESKPRRMSFSPILIYEG